MDSSPLLPLQPGKGRGNLLGGLHQWRRGPNKNGPGPGLAPRSFQFSIWGITEPNKKLTIQESALSSNHVSLQSCAKLDQQVHDKVWDDIVFPFLLCRLSFWSVINHETSPGEHWLPGWKTWETFSWPVFLGTSKHIFQGLGRIDSTLLSNESKCYCIDSLFHTV